MNHFKLVLPGHLNHHGSLFGGFMLKWIDEVVYITANYEFPRHRFVTIALDHVEFRHGVQNGEILRLSVQRERLGNTSVHYRVCVFGTRLHPDPEAPVFETTVSLVNVDEEGHKRPIEPPGPASTIA